MSIRVAIVVATLVFAGSALQGSNTGDVLPIDGGTFEASGVVALSGGVLFVDDGRPDEVFWMPLDGAGRQTAAARSLNIGIAVHDKEGITTDGTHIYVVGSQSKKNPRAVSVSCASSSTRRPSRFQMHSRLRISVG